MRKLILFLHMSLDGFVEGPGGEMDISFVSYDGDLENQADQVLSTADTIIWGRKTYQGMYEYWPQVLSDPNANAHELNHAKWIEQVDKVVFSNTLDQVEWTKTRLVENQTLKEVKRLKTLNGGDMVILGSPRLGQFLMKEGLIDEYKLTVSPVLVGGGLRLFDHLSEPISLQLVESKTFDSGALYLNYRQEVR